jgi:hypothetical protein
MAILPMNHMNQVLLKMNHQSLRRLSQLKSRDLLDFLEQSTNHPTKVMTVMEFQNKEENLDCIRFLKENRAVLQT